MNSATDIDNSLKIIFNWLSENEIGTTTDKRKSISEDLLLPIVKSGIKENDITIINQTFKVRPLEPVEGNIWELLQVHFGGNQYSRFMQKIADLTPVGLNTSPNACCGKWELLVRVLLPKSRQPKKGDILYNGKIYEIKGSEVRIQDQTLTGKAYKKNCDDVFGGGGLIRGNTIRTGGLAGTEAYEIEKSQHREHYKPQFDADIPTAKMLIKQYLDVNGWDGTDENVESIFADGGWNQDVMNRIILAKMFSKYKKSQGFDRMYIFGDGTNVKIISDPADLYKVQITADYFRINQTEKVGWYIS